MATLKDEIAALRAEITDLRAQVAAKPRAGKVKSTVRTFATKAERDAGNGFPCTASDPCGRTDLRMADSGASHDPKAKAWHNAK